jgi:isoamyl acetate esterase
VKREDHDRVAKIRLLTIWFGANDACLPHSPQHVPLERYKSNLTEMIQMVKESSSPYYSPHTNIILITPPPLNEEQRKADLDSRVPPQKMDRSFDTTKAYAQGVKDVAESQGVGVLDVWETMWQEAGKNSAGLVRLLCDGLHLTPAGYQVCDNSDTPYIRSLTLCGYIRWCSRHCWTRCNENILKRIVKTSNKYSQREYQLFTCNLSNQ